MRELVIQSHKGPYKVHFEDAFAGISSGLQPNEHLIIDRRVAEIYSKPLAAALSASSVLRIEASERNKSLDRIPEFINHLLGKSIRRDHTLIAVGGGIIQDITAFIATILFRGIPWRFYPTTLLAQADSCIGSKTSINIGDYKNQVGTFAPPDHVHISADVLHTLSHADLCSGIGEMLKVHIIAGWDDLRSISRDYDRLSKDFDLLTHYIIRSLEIKKRLAEIDEFDKNERLIMNYGHSFGHAIETATDYAVPHGIAVTIGADIANYVSWRSGLIEGPVYEEMHSVLARNFAGFENTRVPADRFFQALGRDKKNVGNDLTLILTKGPGLVFRTPQRNDERFQAICADYFKSLNGKVWARTAAGGPALHDEVVVAEPVKRIGIGIIGMGKMGRIRQGVLEANPAARVVAVSDAAQALGDLGGIRVLRSPEDVLKDPEVDAIFICTPNHLNQTLTLAGLRAGKHVFCEKPPAFTASQVEEIIRVEAASGGMKLMYGFNHRHHESIRYTKNLVDSGAFGRILWMRGRYGKSVDNSFYNNWRSKKALAGGGIMIDQGIHMLDLLLMLAGDFDEVHAFVSNLYWELDVEDNVFAHFRNRDGVVASLHSTMTQWRHLFSLEIFMEKGSLIINGLLTPSGTYGSEAITITKNRTAPPAATWTEAEELVFDVDNSWKHEVDHFLSAIQNDTPINVGTSRDALKLMRLMDRIYEHSATRTERLHLAQRVPGSI